MTATAYLTKTAQQEARVMPVSGEAILSLPLDLPSARNAATPSISIEVSCRRGNDVCGFGAGLAAAGRIFRRDRLELAWSERPLVLEGVGELVLVDVNEWRPVEAASRCKVVGWTDGALCVVHPDGRRDIYGETGSGRTTVSEQGAEVVVQWLHQRSELPDADPLFYEYLGGIDVPLVSRVHFGPYSVFFEYEARPDPVIRAYADRLLTLDLRLASASLLHRSGAGPQDDVLRRWLLSYSSHVAGWSVLNRVQIEGVDSDGQVDVWPALSLEVFDASAADATVVTPQLPEPLPPPSQGRVGTLNWFGNGRPALYDASSQPLRVFSDELPGASIKVLQAPQTLFDYPGRSAFSDVSGDGLSDLILLGDDIAGQFRALGQGRYSDFEPWEFAVPPGILFGSNALLCDIDGDGGNEVVCFDDAAGLWLAFQPARLNEPAKRQTLQGDLPENALDGKVLHLADATGDGLADFVHIDGDRVRLWLNKGRRTFDAAREVVLERPELLQDSPNVGFADFTGDGAADLYALDGTGVHLWLNQACKRFRYFGRFELDGIQSASDMIVCDWHGLGRSGILWWPGASEPKFLSPLGMGALGALAVADNGMGVVQTFDWSTTARESQRARRSGRPWTRELPFPLVVCSQVVTSDAINATSRTMQYGYENPALWLGKRRFLGFESAEIRQMDESGNLERSTEIEHHIPETSDPPLGQVVLAGSLKSLRLRARSGDTFPWIQVKHESAAWMVRNRAGEAVAASALLQRSITEHFDVDGTAYSKNTVEFGDIDQHGRPCRIAETAHSVAANIVVDGHPIATPERFHRLVTHVRFADEPMGRYLDRRCAVRQEDGDGALLSATLYYYDSLPNGAVGTNGRLTSAYSMVLSDAQATSLASETELSEIGYLRVENEKGWWRRDRDVEETQDPEGRRITRLRDALDHTVESTYDPSGIWVERSSSPAGVCQFVPDPRSNRPAQETDEFGLTRKYFFDGLSRLRKVEDPSLAHPILIIDPDFARGGVVLHQRALADAETGAFTHSSEVFDALGRRRRTLTLLSSGEKAFSSGIHRYNQDGRLVSKTVAHAVGTASDESLVDDLPKWTFEYDALNRVTSASDPSGARRTLQYVGPWIIEADPLRPSKARRVLFTDARGHITLATSGDGTAVARQERDARGNTTEVTDLFGRESTFEYDLLGRQIRSSTPDGGTQSILLDAIGTVRKTWRAGELAHELIIDHSGRPEQAKTLERTECRFDYNPLTSAAGAGLVSQALSPSGVARFEYDRGQRVSARSFKRRGAADELKLQYKYRTDGKLISLSLPQGANVRWNYDQFGRIESIPGFVKNAEYASDGTLYAITFQNGVRTELHRESDRSRIRACKVSVGEVELLHSGVTRYGGDVVGEWQDGGLRKTVIADALGRLVGVRVGDQLQELRSYNEQHWLTEVGGLALEYDSQSRLTKAGADEVVVDPGGNVTKWGERTFEYDGKNLVRAVRSLAGARRYDVDHEGRVCAAYNEENNLVFYQPHPYILETAEGLFAFIYFGSLPVARVRLLPDGNMSEAAFLHHDVLGRLALVTNALAKPVKEFRFDAAGAPKAVLGNHDEALDLLFEGNRFVPIGDCYLQGARLYAPNLGRFLGADIVAYDAADALNGDRYLFARGNPLQRGDPTGLFFDDFWREASRAWNDWGKKLVMAIAVVVIAIYASPAILVGMAIGAIVGGLAANQKGGDVIEGMLFGALLGAAGAWGAGGISAGSGIWGAAAAGALKGAVTGAAMGLAAGYAGGAGSSEEMLQATARGALTGAIAGAVLGAGSEWLSKAKTTAVDFDTQRAKGIKALGEGLNAGNDSVSAVGKGMWAFAEPYVQNGLIDFGKWVFQAGAWGTPVQVITAAAAGYQAGGFGKPLELVIWQDVLGQHAEGQIFGTSF